ncbi:TPA: hypothetical protein DEX28_03030 [Patescibacteria group bacterium]|nr:hypothetical protein [Patescibacteria group bacterium]
MTEWPAEQKSTEPAKTNFQLPKFSFNFKKTGLIIGLVVVLSGLALAFFTYIVNLAPPDYLGLNVLGSNSVNLGEKTLFEVVVSNRAAKETLKEVSLVIRVDDGTVLSDSPSSTLIQKEIGDIPPQTDYKELVPSVFWGRGLEQRTVEITARYRRENQTVKTEKTFVWQPRIANTGANLAISMPQQALSGEDFSGYLTYKNAAEKIIESSKLVLEPPKDFSVSFIDPKFDQKDESGNLVWVFKDLEPQKEKRINFKAQVSGSDASGKVLKLVFKVPVRNKDIVITDMTEDIVVASNPFSLGVVLNGTREHSPNPGQNLRYQISFKNNYDVTLKDVVIIADFSDAWFEMASLKLDSGFYSSKTKKITWNGGNTPQLLALKPQEFGEVQVYLNIKDVYPEDGVNNILKMNVEISSANKPGSIGTEVLAKNELVSNINGRLALIPKLLFKDNLQTGFLNSGTATPKVNKVTQYSLYLKLQAQANDFKNVFVTTTFPTNVSYDGRIKGDTNDTDFVFNSRTGQLTWRVDYLPAWQEKNIVFQVSLTPSSDQLGRLIQVVNDMNVSGDDMFTANKFNENVQGIYSDLPDDSSVDQENGRVEQ